MVDLYPTPTGEHAPGPCPGCGAKEPRPSRHGNGSFSVVRCADCNLWCLTPRVPEQSLIDRYAQADFFSGGATGYEDYSRQEKGLRTTFRALLRRLDDRGLTGGSLLEVGCGYGYFLDEASPFFNFRAGLEMSSDAASHARDRADAIHNGALDTLPNHKFDCIVALHVIEHVYDPQLFLRQLLKHLAPGGSLILAAPDITGFWRPLLGKHLPISAPPEHATHYTARTLRRLMEEAGCRHPQNLPCPHALPVSELCAKIGLKAPRLLQSRNIWLPAKTAAVVATI